MLRAKHTHTHTHTADKYRGRIDVNNLRQEENGRSVFVSPYSIVHCVLKVMNGGDGVVRVVCGTTFAFDWLVMNLNTKQCSQPTNQLTNPPFFTDACGLCWRGSH